MRWYMMGFSVVVIVLAITAAASANDYFPMCTGSMWEYDSLDGKASYTKTCTGTDNFWGVECAVFENSGPGDEGLSQYYYTDDDDAVLLRGFFREIEGWGILYVPGIQMMSADPYVGQEWCTTAEAYDLPDYGYMGTNQFCLAVHEEVDLSLPAGMCRAFGVGPNVPPPLREGFDWLGHSRSSALGDSDRWYSRSIGVVQFITMHTYRLAGFSLPPSAVEVASWGRIKALYR
jgi:hypothetical protein